MSSPSAPQPLLITEAQATRINGLEPEDVSSILRLAALGKGPSDIIGYAESIVNGDPIAVSVPSGAPRPIVIQAWSFLKDRNQYNGVYGLSSEQVGALIDDLARDRDGVIAGIRKLVAEYHAKRGSRRPVSVITDGLPTGNVGGARDGPRDDGGLRSLKTIIARNSGIYGSYKFVAVESKRSGGQAYRVNLGGGLVVLAQSKPLAIAVARIVRVEGRSYPDIANFVYFWPEGTSPKSLTDIRSDVFDGRLGPSDPFPADPVSKAKTEAPAGRA